MYYEIYIDQLFLENLIIMVLVLRTWGKIRNLPLSWKKIWGISVIGAVAVCAVIFFRPEWGLAAKIAAWGTVILLDRLLSHRKAFRDGKHGFLHRTKAAGYKNSHETVWNLLSFLGTLAVYGGTVQMIFSIWEPPVLLAAVLAYMAVDLLIDRQRERMVLGECRTEVTLEDQGDRWKLTGLIDTGNHLKEPITGRPVSILNWQEAEKIPRFRRIQQEEGGYLYIPFHSIGTEKGWMMGIVVDAMIIRYRGEEIMIEHPVLAVSRERLNTSGQYQMILNPLHILGGRKLPPEKQTTGRKKIWWQK